MLGSAVWFVDFLLLGNYLLPSRKEAVAVWSGLSCATIIKSLKMVGRINKHFCDTSIKLGNSSGLHLGEGQGMVAAPLGTFPPSPRDCIIKIHY